jgi:hypothetical protein
MSHTVLKTGKGQSSNTLFDQWSGTLEVYWEMMMSKAVQRKCHPSNKVNPSTKKKKTGGVSSHRAAEQDECEDEFAMNEEYQKPVQVQRMKSGSNFIDAKFIFK